MTMTAQALRSDSRSKSNHNEKTTTSGGGGDAKKGQFAELDERKTAWRSLILCCAVMLLLGIQFSIYYNSIWPYLSSLDNSVSFSFMGVCIASYSVGQVLTSPLFGLWTQRTLSVKRPAAVGIVLTIFGNLLYAMLPFFKNHNVQWWMLGSRFLVGLGSGNLAVFRAYVATASTPRDRSRAVAMSMGSYVFGIAVGPVMQTAFTPIGETGWTIGSGTGGFILNMYTTCALAMSCVNVISLLFLLLAFEEDYRGILKTNAKSKVDEKTATTQMGAIDDARQTYFVLPKFDRGAVCVVLYLWFAYNFIATNLEAMSSPITQVFYNWKDRDAVLHNGIMQAVSCIIDIAIYAAMSLTWIGRINPRKGMVLGVVMFALYYLIMLPWPFYSGRLRLMHLRPNSTTEDTSYDAGCYRSYKWCPGQHHPPVFMYAIAYVVCLGVSFPFISTPAGVLYSQMIGPRNQANMQGLLAFVGGLGRIIGPIVSTFLFEHTGYIAQSTIILSMLTLFLGLLFLYRDRMVPLKAEPEVGGKAAVYKGGVFSRV